VLLKQQYVIDYLA